MFLSWHFRLLLPANLFSSVSICFCWLTQPRTTADREWMFRGIWFDYSRSYPWHILFLVRNNGLLVSVSFCCERENTRKTERGEGTELVRTGQETEVATYISFPFCLSLLWGSRDTASVAYRTLSKFFRYEQFSSFDFYFFVENSSSTAFPYFYEFNVVQYVSPTFPEGYPCKFIVLVRNWPPCVN